VTLEDAGRFACPHCGNEFEAEHEPEAPKPTPPPSITKSKQPFGTANWLGIALALIAGFVVLVFYSVEQIKSIDQSNTADRPGGTVAILSKPTATRDAFGTFEITGTAFNQCNSNLRSVVITFTLYDRDNSIVGYATDKLAILEPGQRWRYRAVAFEKEAASYLFRDLSVDLFGRVAVKLEFEK
jgi:hypothetical protein